MAIPEYYLRGREMKFRQCLHGSMVLLGVVFGAHFEAKAVDVEPLVNVQQSEDPATQPLRAIRLKPRCNCYCVIPNDGSPYQQYPVEIENVSTEAGCKKLNGQGCVVEDQNGGNQDRKVGSLGCDWRYSPATDSVSTTSGSPGASSADNGKW